MDTNRVKWKNMVIVVALFLFLLILGIYFFEKNVLLTPQGMTQKCVESKNWTDEQCGVSYFED